MARRAQSNVTDFLTNFNAAYGLTTKIAEDWQSAKLANAEEEDGPAQYTQPQTEQIQALSEAKDQHGNPYYTLDANPDGSYGLKTNFAYQGADGGTQAAGTTFDTLKPEGASGQVKYLDKTYDKAAFTPEVKRNALARAQADLAGRFDVQRGADMHASLDKREQDNKLFDQTYGLYQRKIKALDDDEAYQKALQTHYEGSLYGQRMGQYAKAEQDWQTAMTERNTQLAKGAKLEDLPSLPERPTMPSYSAFDALADQGRRLHFDLSQGRASSKDLADYSATMQKIQDGGYIESLRLAQEGAPLQEVLNTLRQKSGLNIPDERVLDYQIIPRSATTPGTTRITYLDDNGKEQTIDTRAQLDRFGEADKYYNRAKDAATAQHNTQRLLTPGLSRSNASTSSNKAAAPAAPLSTVEQVQKSIEAIQNLGDSLNKPTAADILGAKRHVSALHQLNAGRASVEDLAHAALYIQQNPDALATAPVALDPLSGKLVRTLPSQLSSGQAITLSDRIDDGYLQGLDRRQRRTLTQNLLTHLQHAGISAEQAQAIKANPDQAQTILAKVQEASAAKIQQLAEKSGHPISQDTLQRTLQANQSRILQMLNTYRQL